MHLTQNDIKKVEVLKETREGTVIETSTLGGLHIIFLKKSSGEVEMLASSTSSLRSQAMANKKYPHLQIPVIVKSSEKKGDKMPLIPSGSKKAIGQNISELEHANADKPTSKKRPHKQIVAIALANAREHGAKIPKKKTSEESESSSVVEKAAAGPQSPGTPSSSTVKTGAGLHQRDKTGMKGVGPKRDIKTAFASFNKSKDEGENSKKLKAYLVKKKK